MPIFLVDFNKVLGNPQVGLTQAVQLGYESQYPELHEGQHVIVDMPGELWAEAQATHRDDERGRYWYGELVGTCARSERRGV